MYFCVIILGVSSTNSGDFPLEPFVERYHPQQVRAGDERGPFSRDRDRIIHSSAFRRLQSKTQVSAPREGDVHRTRLTHSLETGQIGEAIATRLHGTAVPEEWIPGGDLISAACYAHDLGHPPLGHAGEQTLHGAINGVEFDDDGEECLKTYGGFEANAQTLRLLTRLMPYARSDQGDKKTLVLIPGINLTRRTLLAILKYPRSYGSCAEEVASGKLPKCYFDSEQEIVEWMAEPFPEEDRKRFLGQRKYKTLDSAVMDIADEIAYCTHDMEDAIARGFLTQEQFQEGLDVYLQDRGSGDRESIKARINEILEASGGGGGERLRLFSESEAIRKHAISKLIHTFITNVIVKEREQFRHPLLRYYLELHSPQDLLLDFLRHIVWDKVINRPTQKMLEIKGQYMLKNLFDVFMREGEQIIVGYESLEAPIKEIIKHDGVARARLVVDYLATMTDHTLTKNYQMLFTPGFGSSKEEH